MERFRSPFKGRFLLRWWSDSGYICNWDVLPAAEVVEWYTTSLSDAGEQLCHDWFPVELYPTEQHLPTKRTELPIWENLPG